MLSVIVPCYNEEQSLAECHRRLTAVLAPMLEAATADNFAYEIIYIDDGSSDNTPAFLAGIHAADPRTAVVTLARNFGHQPAVTAGLALARGAAAVILDADMQDPPEVIPKMLALWREGYQVIYGVRTVRAGESDFKLWTAKLFYKTIRRLADVAIPLDSGDFRLVDRAVIDALLSMPERHRLLRAMCSWVGYKQVGLPYQRSARFAGTTKYPLWKMVHLALDGIFSFSTVPLRMLTFVGLGAACLSFAGVVYALFVRLFTHHWVQGWATLFIGMLFLSGLQMISLGIMGEYLGRIYTEVKKRPLYIIAASLPASSDGSTRP